jgi:hypothetical protein
VSHVAAVPDRTAVAVPIVAMSDSRESDGLEDGDSRADRASAEQIEYARAVHGISRSGGDGARSATEEWVHQHSRPESNDGRSPTRTTFYASDTDSIGPGQQHRDPSDRTSWSKLAKWQDGVQSDISRGGQNWAADKERWFDTFASHIEATDRQEKRARHIVESVSMDPFKGARIPIENVIAGALSLAVDEDAQSLDSRAVERERFIELLADLEMDRADLRDVRRKLRAEL